MCLYHVKVDVACSNDLCHWYSVLYLRSITASQFRYTTIFGCCDVATSQSGHNNRCCCCCCCCCLWYGGCQTSTVLQMRRHLSIEICISHLRRKSWNCDLVDCALPLARSQDTTDPYVPCLYKRISLATNRPRPTRSTYKSGDEPTDNYCIQYNTKLCGIHFQFPHVDAGAHDLSE